MPFKIVMVADHLIFNDEIKLLFNQSVDYEVVDEEIYDKKIISVCATLLP
ncbi:hypothetical protein [Emticicia sp.]